VRWCGGRLGRDRAAVALACRMIPTDPAVRTCRGGSGTGEAGSTSPLASASSSASAGWPRQAEPGGVLASCIVAPLGQRLVVAVLVRRWPRILQVLHGPAQQPGVLDGRASSVKSAPWRAGRHLPDGARCLPSSPGSATPAGITWVRPGSCPWPPPSPQPRVVADRIRVRHGADRRVPAEHRRRRARGDGLLVLPPGSRRCTWVSTKPGARSPVRRRSPRRRWVQPGPTASIRPPEISTSQVGVGPRPDRESAASRMSATGTSSTARRRHRASGREGHPNGDSVGELRSHDDRAVQGRPFRGSDLDAPVHRTGS